MFNLFKKVYTVKDVEEAIMAKVILYTEAIKEQQKLQYKSVPAKIEKEYNNLSRLGLTNSKNAKILKEKIDEIRKANDHINDLNNAVEHTKKTVEFLKSLIDHFGNHVMLVKFDDFQEILKKYNLVCGTLDQYIGTIPDKNLEELNYTISKLKDFNINLNNTGISSLRRITEVPSRFIVSKESQQNINRFPFVESKTVGYTIVDHIIALNKTVGSYELNFAPGLTKLFIAAPAKDMKVEGVKFSKFIETKDPFICSYSPYGIIIHSKWGEEAEDEILKKYYDLIK